MTKKLVRAGRIIDQRRSTTYYSYAAFPLIALPVDTVCRYRVFRRFSSGIRRLSIPESLRFPHWRPRTATNKNLGGRVISKIHEVTSRLNRQIVMSPLVSPPWLERPHFYMLMKNLKEKELK